MVSVGPVAATVKTKMSVQQENPVLLYLIAMNGDCVRSGAKSNFYYPCEFLGSEKVTSSRQHRLWRNESGVFKLRQCRVLSTTNSIVCSLFTELRQLSTVCIVRRQVRWLWNYNVHHTDCQYCRGLESLLVGCCIYERNQTFSMVGSSCTPTLWNETVSSQQIELLTVLGRMSSTSNSSDKDS